MAEVNFDVFILFDFFLLRGSFKVINLICSNDGSIYKKLQRPGIYCVIVLLMLCLVYFCFFLLLKRYKDNMAV